MEHETSDQPKRNGRLPMDIKRYLTLRPKGETSADLRAALQNAERELQQTGELLAVLEASQGEVLLTSGADAIEAHEKQIREAQRAQTSLSAMVAALKPRISAAEEREALAELDRLAAVANAKARAAGLLLPEIFATMAKLADLIEQHDSHIGDMRPINRTLRANQRPGVEAPLRQFWARQETTDGLGSGGYLSTFSDNLVLPGPRRACKTIKDWRAEMERAQTAPATDYSDAAG